MKIRLARKIAKRGFPYYPTGMRRRAWKRLGYSYTVQITNEQNCMEMMERRFWDSKGLCVEIGLQYWTTKGTR